MSLIVYFNVFQIKKGQLVTSVCPKINCVWLPASHLQSILVSANYTCQSRLGQSHQEKWYQINEFLCLRRPFVSIQVQNYFNRHLLRLGMSHFVRCSVPGIYLSLHPAKFEQRKSDRNCTCFSETFAFKTGEIRICTHCK